MAKQFVQISLATKLRTLFGAAVLAIIAAALIVPWYFMELLAERGAQSTGAGTTRLRFNEWLREHPVDPEHESYIAALHTLGRQTEDVRGPLFVRLSSELTATPPLDSTARQALRAFVANPRQELAVIRIREEGAQATYRCFRAVRVEPTCQGCHGASAPVPLQYQPGQLVGVIDMTMSGSEVSGPLLWMTRGAFVVGGVLAGLLAIVTFAIITQRLILRPVRHLRDVADKATEGDLTVRSTIRTGDELQRLGESYNEMLAATADQHAKLRQANRALDLKLSELAEANVTLFQANKVKTEFLTNISHELRTPLNSIIGFADLLCDQEDERIVRYGQNISSSAKHLLNMINDLLDLAKIQAGKAQVRLDRVSVSDTCQTLAALMKPMADKKQLNLTAELADDLPIIETDAGKLQQILYNLLSNAIKFTPAGGDVMLRAIAQAHHRAGKDVPEVAVSVTDTGPGIPESAQEQIFEKFYQADRTLTRQVEGTGLGLAIARELTNLLGGRLTLNSTPGHGAEFTLNLPVEPPKEPAPAPGDETS